MTLESPSDGGEVPKSTASDVSGVLITVSKGKMRARIVLFRGMGHFVKDSVRRLCRVIGRWQTRFLASGIDVLGNDRGTDDHQAAEEENRRRHDFLQEEHFEGNGQEDGDVEHQESDEAVDAPEGFEIQNAAEPAEDPRPHAEQQLRDGQMPDGVRSEEREGRGRDQREEENVEIQFDAPALRQLIDVPDHGDDQEDIREHQQSAQHVPVEMYLGPKAEVVVEKERAPETADDEREKNGGDTSPFFQVRNGVSPENSRDDQGDDRREVVEEDHVGTGGVEKTGVDQIREENFADDDQEEHRRIGKVPLNATPPDDRADEGAEHNRRKNPAGGLEENPDTRVNRIHHRVFDVERLKTPNDHGEQTDAVSQGFLASHGHRFRRAGDGRGERRVPLQEDVHHRETRQDDD